MPDFPTTGPAAGWYADPADPSHERWWGGLEWTHDTRPLQAVAAPAAEPALANVPGGGVNPFAAIDAAPVLTEPVAAFAGAPSAFSDFGAAATGSTAMPADPFKVNASWYDADRRAAPRPEPTNGFATAGLVLSLFGIATLGIIFSVLGLRKANGFELDGDEPVGRTRSRWGLGLGIASVTMTILAGVFLAYTWNAAYAWYLQQAGSQPQVTIQQPVTPTTPVDEEVAAGDVSYVRADYEREIYDEYTGNGETPDSITCPDAGSKTAGSTVTCTIVVGNRTDTRTTDYYEDGGYSMSTSSVIQQ